MKKTEMKLRIETALNSLINTYFNGNNLVEKLTNSTLHMLLKNNINKIDDTLSMFADENGEINAEEIISNYADAIGEGMPFDIRQYIKSDFIRGLLPNKSLFINKQDVLNILAQPSMNKTIADNGN